MLLNHFSQLKAPFTATDTSSSPSTSTVASTTVSSTSLALRPCQRAYLGESNARRLLKRSHLTKKVKSAHNAASPIFTLHEELALQAAAAAAAASPFTANPNPSYTVQCYATFAEDAEKAQRAAAAEKEKIILFHSINASRAAEGKLPLCLNPILSKYAQDYADMLYAEDQSLLTPASTTDLLLAGEPNAVTVVMSPQGSRVARLVSPTKMGALACGEMWYGGKYKRHLYSMPGWEDGEEGEGGMHPDDCPCRLRIAFETMVDDGWRTMGVGRGEDWRWVVELAQ